MLIVAFKTQPEHRLNMTKAVSRKSGKKGRSEDVKTSTVRQPSKFGKRHHEHQEETSRRWMIWLVILCFLIGAVAVFFSPALQFTSREKVSGRKNFDQSKKVKEPKADRASAGRKEKDAGKHQLCL